MSCWCIYDSRFKILKIAMRWQAKHFTISFLPSPLPRKKIINTIIKSKKNPARPPSWWGITKDSRNFHVFRFPTWYAWVALTSRSCIPAASGYCMTTCGQRMKFYEPHSTGIRDIGFHWFFLHHVLPNELISSRSKWQLLSSAFNANTVVSGLLRLWSGVAAISEFSLFPGVMRCHSVLCYPVLSVPPNTGH